MAYTADDIIIWMKISQALASVGERKKAATRGGKVDPDHHIQLYIERKTIEWYNSQATVDQDILYKIANFGYALTFPYGAQAQFINIGSGGQVAPVTPSVGSRPDPLDFIVNDTNTPFLAGETTVTFPQFIGYDVEFYRGGQPQYTTNPGDGSTYFLWNRNTGQMTIYTAAVIGEPFRIVPIGGFATSSSSLAQQRQSVFAIVGATANAPVAGASTWTNSNFANAYVVVFLNSSPVASVDPGTGVPYLTKSFNSDTITISNYLWQTNDELLALIITP